MEKKCLVIMPISDQDGYAQGHFNRVYQYIIVPACRLAGFSPLRMDDPSTHDTASDIIKNIVDSDVVICDLSAKNSNALYGFAIRQALTLPVTLIRDTKTTILYNTQEFGEVEYDESLRIDTVQKEIETLSESLKITFANKPLLNTLLSRLDIGTAKVTEAPYVAEPIYQDESPKKEESHLPVISPLPDYVGDPITQLEIDKLKVGDSLFHMNYGKGDIKTLNKMAKDKVAAIQFESGAKTLVLGTSGIWRKINS